MARKVRDAVLDTRNARRALKTQGKPYWRALDKGFHLGYRRRAKGGTWVARRFGEKNTYVETRIGLADDFQDADGVKTFNYAQAQATARNWYQKEIRKEQGLEPIKRGPYTVADAMQDYEDHYKIEGKGLLTVTTSKNAHILPELGKIEVEKLTSKRISDWHKNLALKAPIVRTAKAAEKKSHRQAKLDAESMRPRKATANRIMIVLKAALNYAWREGKVSSDTAWRKVKPFKDVCMPVVRYITEAEAKRLANACPKDFRKLVSAALFTGCRYGELIALRVNDFNPDARTLLIRTSKSGKPRHVVLTDEAKAFFIDAAIGKKGIDLLFTHGNSAAWGKSHQQRPLLDACKIAKISPAISFHMLRHTHGSMLAMKGVPLPVIAKQLGHADTRMTERHYAHLSPSYVADTIRDNFPTLGINEKSKIVRLK